MSFIENMCIKLAEKLDSTKKVIVRKDSDTYLTRYYLFRKTRNWLPSFYLHCFEDSDEDEELHNHPWKISMSIILFGCYIEERLKNGKIVERIMFPGRINIVRDKDFHRVDLLDQKVWTLFISGPKTQDWGFKDRYTGKYTDWREHEKQKSRKIKRNLSTPENRKMWEHAEAVAGEVRTWPDWKRAR